MKICAGIVLFNPNEERFKKCIQIVLKQFDEIILYDNVGNHSEYANINDKITYLTQNKNCGLAYALNVIMRTAKDRGADWVVTLDQDTMLPDNLLSEFAKYAHLPNVAIFAPQVIDKRRTYLKIEKCKDELSEINFCITSSSFTNVKIWNEIGGFDEWLFIDFIDNDICKRAIINGYKIYRINTVIIDQEFGKIELKSPWKIKFFLWLSKITGNRNIAKLSYNKSVSPMRVYYVHRNLMYLNKKFRDYGGIGYENFYCNSFSGFLLYFTLPSFIRGKQKWEILKAICKGLHDGYKSHPNIL